jgi:hypothetical protein
MTSDIVPVLVSIDNGDPGVRYAIVPSYGGAYAAGDDGAIWSCVKLGGQVRVLTTQWRKLKATISAAGYPHVTILQPTGRHRPFPSHVMVLEAWRGPRPEGLEARHRNDVKSDNRLDNLLWGTASENMLDRGLNGDPTFRGDGHPQAILTTDIVLGMREMVRNGATTEAAALAHNAPLEAARGAIRGRSWAHLPGAVRLNAYTPAGVRHEIRELAAQGLSIPEIMERTGQAYLTVYNQVVRRARRLASQ